MALGLLFFFYKTLGAQRLFKYETLLDVLLTFGLPMFLIGSFNATITALFTGIFFSVILFTMKKLRHKFIQGTKEQDSWAAPKAAAQTIKEFKNGFFNSLNILKRKYNRINKAKYGSMPNPNKESDIK